MNRSERFDAITMFDVIEHLHDPFGTIASIRDMLTDNGVVVITTMDSTSFVSRIMGKRLEDFRRIREHLFFFSRSNLVSILIKQGFEILEVRSHGHSLELRLLATRLRNILPLVGAPMTWLLRIFPFAGSWSIYLDPRTKFIVYSRKRRQIVPALSPAAVLSIVVPVFNEAATIERVLDALVALDVGVRRRSSSWTTGPRTRPSRFCSATSRGTRSGRYASRQNRGERGSVAAGSRRAAVTTS